MFFDELYLDVVIEVEFVVNGFWCWVVYGDDFCV